MNCQTKEDSIPRIDGITFEDVQKAQNRISKYIHQTPVMTCSSIDSIINNNLPNKKFQLFYKCENLQKTGSFKVYKMYR